jgi:hypothetical protein
MVVFSHWVDHVCVGSTQVELPTASRTIGLLVEALQDAATGRVGVPEPGETARRSAKIINRLLDRFRSASAQIAPLAERPTTATRRQTAIGSD